MSLKWLIPLIVGLLIIGTSVLAAEAPTLPLSPRWELLDVKNSILCNCYDYVKLVVNVPRTDEVIPNSTPKIGSVAIFTYKDKVLGTEVRHWALTEELEEAGLWITETNFTKCKYSRRFILWNDPHLVGFFTPNTEPRQDQRTDD